MLRTILLALLIMTCMTGTAQALDACMSGKWHDPAIKAEGISVAVLADDVVTVDFWTWGFWDGDTQNWVIFVGHPDQMDAFDVVSFEGRRNTYNVGTGSVVAVDDNTLEFSHDFGQNLDLLGDGRVVIPYCLDHRCEHTYTYIRLSQPIPCH